MSERVCLWWGVGGGRVKAGSLSFPGKDREGEGLGELRTGQEQTNSALRGNVMYRWNISKDSGALGSSS